MRWRDRPRHKHTKPRTVGFDVRDRPVAIKVTINAVMQSNVIKLHPSGAVKQLLLLGAAIGRQVGLKRGGLCM